MTRLIDQTVFGTSNQASRRDLNKILLGLDPEHKKRVNRYKEYWDFYEGKHWTYPNDANVTLNYSRRIVDTKSNFLSKNGFDIEIPEDPLTTEADPIARSFIKNALDSVWKYNNKDLWIIKALQMGGVTGDLFIRVSWDESARNVDLSILPSHYVFPVYGGRDGFRGEVMTECRVIFPVEEEHYFQRGIIRKEIVSETRTNWYEEIWTPEKYELRLDGEVIDSKENVLREIPIVHILNYPNTNDHFGISDLADIIDIQRKFNEKATDISDIIDYHGSPVTILKGAQIQQLDRGPDKIWSLPGDADIHNLELKGDLRANLEFLGVLYRSFMDISGVPEQAINPTKNISNTPGVALHMAYLPLIEIRAVKSLSYGEGLQKVNKLAMQILELRDAEFSRHFSRLRGNKYATLVSFGPSLPRDKSLELSTQQQELLMGINSRKRILMSRGMGEQDAIRVLQEADEDMLKRAEIQAQVKALDIKGESGDVAYGKLRKPDPVVQGDKVSTGKIGQ